MSVDWMSKAAKLIFDFPEQWQWRTSTFINGGFILSGSVMTISKSGKKKFNKPYDKCIITDSDIILAKNIYELETGNCADCEGSGREWAGYSAESGKITKPCKKCNETGKANI
jgi:hypothetical protein